jgi:hypothetical protein
MVFHGTNLRMKRFRDKWCQWIKAFIQGGHVEIKVNDWVRKNFQTFKGLWQGDPLSPILFTIVLDVLAMFINRAKNEGLIEVLLPNMVDVGSFILQYATDTVGIKELRATRSRTRKKCEGGLAKDGWGWGHEGVSQSVGGNKCTGFLFWGNPHGVYF